jgi:hypothetical protein
MSRSPKPPLPEDSPLARTVVEEKRRILRLLRALDRADIDPARETALQQPLVRLADADAFLSAILAFVERNPEVRAADVPHLGRVLTVTEGLRGEVVDALGPRDQRALRRASDEVTASEAEIWLEVRALEERRDPGAASRPPGPASTDEVERIAAATWGSGDPSFEPDAPEKVRELEQRLLPGPQEPLEAFLAWLPAAWRQVVAHLHDVPLEGAGTLAGRIASRLSESAWLRRYLAERLGATEREILARLLAMAPIDIGTVGDDFREVLEVDWDWQQRPPATAGGKLRAAGFLFVGRHEGRTLCVVPTALRARLAEALEAVDPAAAAIPDRALRQHIATAMHDAPFDDEELGEWKALDRKVCVRIEQWEQEDLPLLKKAFDSMFEGRPREVSAPEELSALLDIAFLDVPEGPGLAPLVARRLKAASFETPAQRALAEAITASRPGLYRIGEPRRGLDVPLKALFPEGPETTVHDRALSLTAEVGWLLAARPYPAGPYRFMRVAGPPVPPESEKHVLRRLRRALRLHAKRGGAPGAAALLRQDPALLFHLLRDFGG